MPLVLIDPRGCMSGMSSGGILTTCNTPSEPPHCIIPEKRYTQRRTKGTTEWFTVPPFSCLLSIDRDGGQLKNLIACHEPCHTCQQPVPVDNITNKRYAGSRRIESTFAGDFFSNHKGRPPFCQPSDPIRLVRSGLRRLNLRANCGCCEI